MVSIPRRSVSVSIFLGLLKPLCLFKCSSKSNPSGLSCNLQNTKQFKESYLKSLLKNPQQQGSDVTTYQNVTKHIPFLKKLTRVSWSLVVEHLNQVIGLITNRSIHGFFSQPPASLTVQTLFTHNYQALNSPPHFY